MRKLCVLGALAALLTSGCAVGDSPKVAIPPPPTEVKVPVTVPCFEGEPIVRPDSRLDALPAGTGLLNPTKAALADREETCAYVAKLEAAAKACGIAITNAEEPLCPPRMKE